MSMFRVFILFFVCSFFSFSQDMERSIPDSLERARIENLLSRAESFYKTDLDSALFYINEAELDSKRFNSLHLQSKIRWQKSNYLLYKKEYGSIIPTLQPNVDYASEIELQILGRSYLNIGHAYKQEWLPDSALVYYIKALKAFEKTKNNRDISLTYLSLGLTYSKLENNDLAKSFYDKSLEFSTNSKIMEMHKDQLVNQENPISYDQSLEFSKDIAKIAEDRKDYRQLVITYDDIKNDLFRLKRYDEALEYAQKEMVLRKQTKFNSTIPNTLNFMGKIYQLQGKQNLAIEKFNKAIPNATDSLKLTIYNNLKKAYLELGNTTMAIESMEHYISLKDSINNRRTQESIAKITAQYQDEKQKQEIQTLSFQNEAKEERISNQRIMLFSVVLGSILIFLLAFFAYRNYKSKQELQYSQLNFKLLQTQLNPHFLFNALNEIKLNLSHNKTEESSEYLTSYSKLMRLILEGSNEDFVSLNEDVELISKFLHLQQLVNNGNFTYTVNVDEALNLYFTQIPPMLIQPFVENAVLHGVKTRENGKIDIIYKLLNEERVVITITDNGVGIFKSMDTSGKNLHKSLATSIIDKRIKDYSKLFNYKIDIDIQSEENKGTRVTITLPHKLKKT